MGNSPVPKTIDFGGQLLTLFESGALWWPRRKTLVVSDMHLCKGDRIARLGGSLLPPYDSIDTLRKLQETVDQLRPERVLSLGDSFDDVESSLTMSENAREAVLRVAAGRQLIWVAGNHDPMPVSMPGSYVSEYALDGIAFRHISESGCSGPEISGHYHPKASVLLGGRKLRRQCFVLSGQRLMMPAFGTYTGGLDVGSLPFRSFTTDQSRLFLLGSRIAEIPMSAACLD